MTIFNAVSFTGIFVLMFIAWVISKNRRIINRRVILLGLTLQCLFALFIFRFSGGTKLFLFCNSVVDKILSSAVAGSQFLFGRLAIPPGQTNQAGESSLGFFLAFQALPTIVFFAALMELLYHFKVMPAIIRFFSIIFTRLMRISGAESLSVSSNIFVGIESTLTIRPFLKSMTSSELCTILTAGMGTIASSVMAMYVFILQKDFPMIAGHLISASLLSAPACIIMAKLIYPETGNPETLGINVRPEIAPHPNWITAVMNGARNGMKLVMGIASLLLALLGLMALLDIILGGIGTLLAKGLGWDISLSLKGLLAYLFYPFSLITGVPPGDALTVSRLVGERAVVTEVVAYQDLAAFLSSGKIIEPRSAVIAVYSLCGFAHIASLAIFIGGTAALVPERTKELAAVGFRALIAATLACLMTGAVAGAFYSSNAFLFL